MMSAFLHLLHIFKCTSDYIFHGSKQYEPRLNWEQSDLGPYHLQYRLPKNINRQEEQATKVGTGPKG